MQDTGDPIITVKGSRVGLGPARRDLLPLYQAWKNQLESTRFLRMDVYSLEQEQDWYARVSKGEDIAFFTIYELETLIPIGRIDLHDINRLNQTAELAILIGNESARGKGYGTEAVRLMCDFGFNVLGLRNIMLRTVEWNTPGRKVYERVGFREIGRRKECRFVAGTFWDDILYELLASEFESPVLKKVLLDGLPEPS